MKNLIIERDGKEVEVTAIDINRQGEVLAAMTRKYDKKYMGRDLDGRKYYVYEHIGFLHRKGYTYEPVNL